MYLIQGPWKLLKRNKSLGMCCFGLSILQYPDSIQYWAYQPIPFVMGLPHPSPTVDLTETLINCCLKFGLPHHSSRIQTIQLCVSWFMMLDCWNMLEPIDHQNLFQCWLSHASPTFSMYQPTLGSPVAPTLSSGMSSLALHAAMVGGCAVMPRGSKVLMRSQSPRRTHSNGHVWCWFRGDFVGMPWKIMDFLRIKWDETNHIWRMSWKIMNWVVVEPPLWKIWLRQLGWWHSQYGKIKNVPNHQSVNFLRIKWDETNLWRYHWDLMDITSK